MKKLLATSNPEISPREKRNLERARNIANQGMVLLENDGTLPLNTKGKIALFGDGGRGTIKGGTGSGDVNSRFTVNVEEGLMEAGFEITTTDWLMRCKQSYDDARADYFNKLKEKFQAVGPEAIWDLFNKPFREPAMIPVTDEDINSDTVDTAVFVLARNSGEGKDRSPIAGEYELFDVEKDAINKLVASYKKVIVVLNVGGVIDTKFLRETKGINAILLMSQAGNMGGHALADVLTGKVTPSGHLTSTWAQNYTDYPNASEFSHMNGDIHDEYYNESIYVGYRYFDTFNVSPAYPFGYGLSYTSFEVNTKYVWVEKNQIKVKATVKNTGDTYSGSQVVQTYYSAPSKNLEKPYQELAAFAKTKALAPGEEETLTISFAVENMASYDISSGAWVLEEGSYYIRVGTDSRSTKVVAKLNLVSDVVTEKAKNQFVPDAQWDILSSKDATPYSYASEEAEKANAKVIEINPEDISFNEISYAGEKVEIPQTAQSNVITVDDVRAGNATLDELVSQLTVEEMATLCVGTARGGLGSDSVVGAASMTPGAAGDTTWILEESRDVRSVVLADGPAGLRLSQKFMADKDGHVIPGTTDLPIPGLDIILGSLQKPEIPADAVAHYQYCTAIPIATLLAQTWDMSLLEEAGDIIGEEMNEMGVGLWLAPGMNIHRNPLCGRNFEYYSEDPLISGLCAMSETLGVQKHPGVGTTIKHYAFNNQEDNRMHTNAHIDERAIREIYLKGFEIAVKGSQPMSLMSSYNLVNGVHTANSLGLDSIAREEWGFKGIIMTDWGTTGSLNSNGDTRPKKYGCSSPAGCIKAGNDLIMPGSQGDVDNIVKSVGAKAGEVECPITLAELQACAKHMINIIMQTSSYEGASPYKA